MFKALMDLILDDYILEIAALRIAASVLRMLIFAAVIPPHALLYELQILHSQHR